MKKNLAKEERQELILFIISGVLVIIIALGILGYLKVQSPMQQAKKEAIALAKKHTDLVDVDEFYWYNRQQTYFSLVGSDKKGETIAVIVPKSGDKLTVLPQKKGITADKAKALVNNTFHSQTAKKAELGMYDKKPVWEVMATDKQGQITYYLLSFEKGEEIKVIKDV